MNFSYHIYHIQTNRLNIYKLLYKILILQSGESYRLGELYKLNELQDLGKSWYESQFFKTIAITFNIV